MEINDDSQFQYASEELYKGYKTHESKIGWRKP